MIRDYEEFKKFVFQQTSIDLNAYKERQMKRRIDTLIQRNKYDGYDSYSKALVTDKEMLDQFVNYLTTHKINYFTTPPNNAIIKPSKMYWAQKEKDVPEGMADIDKVRRNSCTD